MSRLSVAGIVMLAAPWNCLYAQLVYLPSADGNLSTFVVNPEAGTLAEAFPRLSMPGSPSAAVAEPKGRFLYVVNNGNGQFETNVAGFSIGDGGVLKGISGSPYTIGGYLSDVKTDPAGKFLYVANQANSIVGYTINASTGALTRMTGTPYPAPGGPVALTVDPSGRFLYTSNRFGGSVSAYSIDAVNEFDPLFEEIYDYCEKMELNVDTLIHEVGAGQMEINF
ncbi:MAG: beta-propeller fold lactonase family protein, partial [Acidobacteria bacterium]|nr:beta-propeller fold lactonase family protein [Acidobacteriota bacterium]